MTEISDDAIVTALVALQAGLDEVQELLREHDFSDPWFVDQLIARYCRKCQAYVEICAYQRAWRERISV